MNKKALDQKVRDVITATNQRIIDSALYLVSVTGETDWVKCCEKMDPEVFFQWNGFKLDVWLKLVSQQSSFWVSVIQIAFDNTYNKQLKSAAEVLTSEV